MRVGSTQPISYGVRQRVSHIIQAFPNILTFLYEKGTHPTGSKLPLHFVSECVTYSSRISKIPPPQLHPLLAIFWHGSNHMLHFLVYCFVCHLGFDLVYRDTLLIFIDGDIYSNTTVRNCIH